MKARDYTKGILNDIHDQNSLRHGWQVSAQDMAAKAGHTETKQSGA